MNNKRQILIISLLFLLQSCSSLGGNSIGLGSKKNWHIYETKIDDVILQYSLPDGQSKDSPRVGVPKTEIGMPIDVVNVFHGFWDFSSSRFKPVDVSLKCSIGVARVDANVKLNRDIQQINVFQDYLQKKSYEKWKISNEKKLRLAEYFTPLKYSPPTDFKEVLINENVWFKYYSRGLTYSYPLNEKYYISIGFIISSSSSNKEMKKEAKQMTDTIIRSLKIIRK